MLGQKQIKCTKPINHEYIEVYNKAIDDFAKKVEYWCWSHEEYNQDDLNDLLEIAKKLKKGGI